MAVVYEGNPDQPMKPGDVDGMADWLEEAEAAGYEGEHVFDGSVEDPPHPFWDAKAGRCKPDDPAADEDDGDTEKPGIA